jgi:hypothetical protein
MIDERTLFSVLGADVFRELSTYLVGLAHTFNTFLLKNIHRVALISQQREELINLNCFLYLSLAMECSLGFVWNFKPSRRPQV